ncbi:MAG: PilZ domain-containing protein [Bryobacteraceae bacterium]
MLRQERRQRLRADLHCTLYITLSTKPQPIECETRNLSASGFYCVSREPLLPGEFLQCKVVFPSTGEAAGLVLECIIEVLRTETIESRDSYGIACRIHDYRVAAQRRHSQAHRIA